MRALAGSRLTGINCKAVAFATAKGGVGKTLISTLCARTLARRGRRVLFIDADGQTNATESFNYDINTVPYNNSTKRLFDSGSVSLADITIFDAEPGLDLIPSHIRLFLEEGRMSTSFRTQTNEYPFGRALEQKLDDCAEELKQYDDIIFDCNPHMGLVNFNIFNICDTIICPVAGLDSLTGILTTIKLWNDAKEEILSAMTGEELARYRKYEYLDYDDYYIVLNRYQENTVAGRRIYSILKGEQMTEREEELYGDFYTGFLDSPIPQKVAVEDRALKRRCILDDNGKDAVTVRNAIEKLVDLMIEKEIF